jgi:hypothetical protein
LDEVCPSEFLRSQAASRGVLREWLEDVAPKEGREFMRRGTGFRRLGAAQEKDRKFEGRFAFPNRSGGAFLSGTNPSAPHWFRCVRRESFRE